MKFIKPIALLLFFLMSLSALGQIRTTTKFSKQKKISAKYMAKNKIPIFQQKSAKNSKTGSYKSSTSKSSINWAKVLRNSTQLTSNRYIALSDASTNGKKTTLTPSRLRTNMGEIIAWDASRVTHRSIHLRNNTQKSDRLENAEGQPVGNLFLWAQLQARKKYLVTFSISMDHPWIDLKLEYPSAYNEMVSHTYRIRNGREISVDVIVNTVESGLHILHLYAIDDSEGDGEGEWKFKQCTIQEVQL